MGRANLPTNAIIAVTLNCNSRCTMCNIWQNRIPHELKPREYLKLPRSLRDINITGGEPFLRMDLPDIVRAMKSTAPGARMILNTNGFLPLVVGKQIPKILSIDPKFAVRVSLDGWGRTHDEIRRIPHGFRLALQTLSILKTAGVKDLGISFTMMKKNLKDMQKIFNFTRKEKIELSLTIVTNSPIFFGSEKEVFRPDRHGELEKQLHQVIVRRFRSQKPKEWLRGWFDLQLLRYYVSHHRTLSCDAGRNFFYLDSIGNVFTCHMKNWLLGNIRKTPFQKIWESGAASLLRDRARQCHDCWMICTAKTAMKSHLIQVGGDILQEKLRYMI